MLVSDQSTLQSNSSSRLRTAALACCFFVFAAQANAQAILGKVTDATSQQALSGVRIHLVGTTFGTQTRLDGTYRLPVSAGTHVLRVSYIGYVPKVDTVIVGASGATRDFALVKGGVQLDAAVVIGSRAQDRTVATAPVPIDVLTVADMHQTGKVETSQIIQSLAPSFNFPRPTIADGTDHVRPATLRGLGPDQVLVLVNGKRRHTSALVNVNGTIGRGSTGADLNAIPSSAIERIEILRDGAAAQYGSDAIAGVINIILKSDESTDATLQTGSNYSINRLLSTSRHMTDGDLSTVSANTGRVLAGDGFWHVTGQYMHRGSTDRSLPDTRTQYFAGDPKNSDPLYTAQNHFRSGDALINEYGGFFNGALPMRANGMQVYAFGGATRRDGQAAGNWRLPNGNNTVRSIFPNGFLPFIESGINDISGTIGVRGEMNGWKYDLSGLYGRNSFDFDVTNSENATMGAASPTSFYAGQLNFSEAIGNLDIVRGFPISAFATPLNVALGAEVRRDAYGILAGDDASWKDGGVKVLDGPSAGAQPTPGAQVFPGFRPSDATHQSRNNVAGYVDFETNPIERWLLGVAGRTEHYSDFGSTSTGKISSRFQVFPMLALRGAIQTGFRAPSLGQEFFSSTATNFLNLGAGLVPVEVRTLPVTSGPAVALGAQPLKPETSVNKSLGLAFTPMSNLSFTADYYQITIDDRIVFSGNFTGTAMTNFLAAQGFPGVGSARFFTNAIDTKTRGFDLVGHYAVDLAPYGITRFTMGYNQTKSNVTRIASTPAQLSSQQAILFDRIEQGRIEVGQPRNNLSITLDHTADKVAFNINSHRYGPVGFRGSAANSSLDQIFGAKWVTDVSLSYAIMRANRLTVGADNVFDKYPDRNITGNSNSGIFAYNGISPFGFNGRFVYARWAWER